jgi:hypothetical protein
MAQRGTLTNLKDISNMLDPNGNIAKVIDVLATENQILDDIPWMEGNRDGGHTSTIMTGYPEPSWKLLNYGVPQVKGSTAQITDTCAIMAEYLEVDTDLANLNSYKDDFIRTQMQMFIKGFGTKMAYNLFYGDTNQTPEGFKGLKPRYNAISTDENNSGYNIISAGGTGSDNTSIWLVVWSPETATGIYPKGMEAGFKWKDLGEQTKEDSAGLMRQVYRYYASWNCGFAIPNWRGVARVANIDISDLRTAGDTSDVSANILKNMNLVIDKVEEFIDGGRAAFYMHPEVKSLLRFKMEDKGFAQLDLKEIMGRQNILTMQGIPIRSCRSLLKTESVVS